MLQLLSSPEPLFSLPSKHTCCCFQGRHIVWVIHLQSHHAIRNFRNETGTGAEMCAAIDSGIVTGDALVSYWPSCFSFQPRLQGFSLKKKIGRPAPPSFLRVKAMGTRFVSFLPWEIKQIVLRASWRPQTSSLTSLTSAGWMRLVRSARGFYTISN